METIDRVAEIMLTIEEFSSLLDQETAAIRAADTKTIAKLSERKQFLSLHYQRQLRMLTDRRSDLADLDASVKSALAQSWENFSKKIADNILALEVAKHATRTVIDMIISAVRNAQGVQRDWSYRGTGLTSQMSFNSCVPVAVNRVL